MAQDKYTLVFSSRPSPIPSKDLVLKDYDMDAASDIFSLETGKDIKVLKGLVSSKGFAEITIQISAKSDKKAEQFECHPSCFDSVLEIFSNSTSVSGWDMEMCYASSAKKEISNSPSIND